MLMPSDQESRSRTTAWMFAALNTIEPQVQHLTQLDLAYANEDWAKLRRPRALNRLRLKLDLLSAWLTGRDYLENRFSAADIMMATVLRIPRHIDLIAKMPVLEAYKQRCEARPAFKRALDAQMADFQNKAAA